MTEAGLPSDKAGRQIQERLRDAIRQRQGRLAAAREPVFSRRGLAESLKIVGLCVLAAVAYGIVQDQVTVRICSDYFAIGDIPLLRTPSATLLALKWGVIATWWGGVTLGVPLAFVCRFGPRRKLSASDLVKPVVVLLLTMAAAAVLFGVLGYCRARAGHVWLSEPIVARVPVMRHCTYLADHWAHLAAYTTGFLGGIVIWFDAWRKRRLPASPEPVPALLDADVSRN